MSAMQRLQEFRFKKMQEANATNRNGSQTPNLPKAPSTNDIQRSTSTSTSTNSSDTSSANGRETIVKEESPAIVVKSSDPESEGERDLRKAVKNMSTSSYTHAPSGASKHPNRLSGINGFSSTSKLSQHSSLAAQKSSISSSAQAKLPFKKLVSSFKYTGDDATPVSIDSDESLSSPAPSDTDDVIMMESHTNDSSQSSKHSHSTKRHIISSDEEEQAAVAKPRRRLVRKGDMGRTSTSGTSGTSQKQRPVKRLALDSDDDEAFPPLGSEGGVDDLTSLDQKLAQLQTTFPDTPFDVLKKALKDSDGDFATAASRVVSETSTQLLDLTSKPKITTIKQVALVQKKTGRPSEPSPEHESLRLPSSDEEEVIALSSSDEGHDSLGDDDGPNGFIAQSRKEERALQFFNESTMLELQELTGCSKNQATAVIDLRPFDNYDRLCVTLRKTKGVGEKIVENYLTTTDAIRAVDTMLQTVERVREDLVGILSVWCGDENGKLFANSNTSSNSTSTSTSTKDVDESGSGDSPKSKDDNEDDSESGVDLLEVNSEKVQETEVGRKAMKDFIRKQPGIMAPGFQLKGYQLLGVNWLALLWRKGLSGILADEMGLGKTAQVITFLAHLHEIGERGRFLIIVPASTLSNWLREFEKFCPTLRVKSYYGSQTEREEMRYDFEEDPSYDVLVTTYTMATGNNSERKFLSRQRFQGVVLDEGHMLKNCTTARYKQLMSIKTDFRLLLTGTPLQNNLQELLSLLIFMMPKLFAEHEEVLRTMFKVKTDASSEKSTLLSQERIVRARHMIAPFVLRRKKIQVLKDMPRKTERVIYCDLHPDQKVLYNRIMSSSVVQSVLQESADDSKNTTGEKGKPSTKKSTAASVKKVANDFANILMQLRKAADHPMLFREKYTDAMLKKMAKVITKEVEFCDSRIDYIEEDMSVMTDFELYRLCKQYKSVNQFALPGNQWMRAGKVKVLQRLLPKLINEDKSRILIFSQFTMVLDILESILKTMSIKYLRLDGSTKVDERQPMIDTFNDDDSHKVFLLSTKAGGFGINLTGANVVIMYDLDYNPHNDKQAEDRAHRVGQTRDVEVIKLISKDTIEEQIYQLASLKLKLDQHVSEDHSASNTSDSSSSTPSAGILSLIKQNWKAALSAQVTTNGSEEANGHTSSPTTSGEEEKGDTANTEKTSENAGEGETHSRGSSLSSLLSISSNNSL